MKILRLFSKRVKNKKYSKYTINIPFEIAQKSRLLKKQLKAKVAAGKIVLEEE